MSGERGGEREKGEGGRGCSHMTLLSFLPSPDPLLVDSPNYGMLAPSPSLKRRRLKLDQARLGGKKPSKKDKGEDGGDDDLATDELRMCSSCQRLVDRRLGQLEGQETPIIVALYNKMQLVMGEAGRIHPGYQDMVDSLL